MVLNPDNKYIHFGDNRYEDFTQHKDKDRQQKYLNRSSKIKGNWKNNKYSPNNLSINILWKKNIFYFILWFFNKIIHL